MQTDEVADATSSLDHFMMRKHNADSSKGNSHEADSHGADSAVTKPSADDAVNTLMDPNFMKLSGTEDDLHGRAMQFVLLFQRRNPAVRSVEEDKMSFCWVVVFR